MADRTNDTQSKINEEDRKIQQRRHSEAGQDRSDYQRGSSSEKGGGTHEAEGQFAQQGEAALGGAMGGGPDGTGNTGAQLPGGAQSEFARATGGQTGGLTAGASDDAISGTVDRGAAGGSMSGTTGQQTSGAPGGQGVGTVGTIGGSNRDTTLQQGSTGQSGTSEYGAQQSTDAQREPLGAGHQQSADGGSVTAAGSSSTGPGAGQAGTDRSQGFIGSQGGNRDPQQAGFAERGRGAPDGAPGDERTANRDTDIEGSSKQ